MTENKRPIRPAPIVPVYEDTKVTHIGPGFEQYFGDTPAFAEVSRTDNRRWPKDVGVWS
jgi:hypothetical protein